MRQLFKDLQHVPFEGKNSTNPLSYRFYNASQVVRGKTMEERLKIAVSFWHTLSWGSHPIATETLYEPAWHYITDAMQLAEIRIHSFFDFVEKLNLKYITFFDTDVLPEGKTIQETQKNMAWMMHHFSSEMQRTNSKILWGASNIHYVEHTPVQIDKVMSMLDIIHQLGGENYLLWLGKENLLLDESLKMFLGKLIEHKKNIGYQGKLLLHAHPNEIALLQHFLQENAMEDEFKWHITEKMTISKHIPIHNWGGVDVDLIYLQSIVDAYEETPSFHPLLPMFMMLLRNHDLYQGGMNMDAKSFELPMDLMDLYCMYIQSINTLARALLIADDLISMNQPVESAETTHSK